ncbi:MAG: hypothetical protein KAR42_16905 [candidate division Zixibacteria bacterium]|nr:hypothetical protein [candidate division Zixibacteria bacterium]
MRVEVNLEKFNPWLTEKRVSVFCVCFAHPKSKSKKKIMIRLDKMQFFTLFEIEEEIGEAIFTITD